MDNLKTILNSRSRCQSCKKTLQWYDLIPLISFVLLRGKCRYCGKPISWQYPLVELSLGIMFAVLYLFFGLSLTTLFYIVVFSILTVVFVHDLKTQTVPEPFIWTALGLSLLFGWYFAGVGFLSLLYGGLISGGILALLVYISKEKWMGAGDIKIGLIQGFLVGYPVAIFASFLSFFLGAIIGLVYVKVKKKTLKEPLPFAPFLIFSTLMAVLFGNILINWYFGYLYM